MDWGEAVSGAGSPSTAVRAEGARVAILAGAWHEEIMAGLTASAQRTAEAAGASTTVFTVPGSFELPLAAQTAAAAGFDAVVALGVIIRGGTPHFEYVSDAATSGLNRVALDTGVPIGFGVLTCDNEQQAFDRSGLPGAKEDKGAEATAAALAMIATLRDIREA